jgi:murein L,D-transpeptidase YafK
MRRFAPVPHESISHRGSRPRRGLLIAMTVVLAVGLAGQTSFYELDPEYGFSLEALAKYRDMVKQTVRKSAERGDYAIVVDKAAYRLYVLKSGRLEHEFPIELGRDPIHDKVKSDYRSTPEGFYKILYSQEGAQTRFYKALTIDYPNLTDLAEFAALQQQGLVGESDSVGGEIQIHGGGSGKAENGGGFNWTAGCVALGNPDIDRFFDLVKAGGTPVTIVRFGGEMLLKKAAENN